MTDRYVEIAISKDKGRTFGDWTLHYLGDYGDWDFPPPTRRRLGIGKDWRVKFRITSPCTTHLIAAQLDIG